MFAQDFMLGEKEIKLDEKHRIWLPGWTFACKDDLLALEQIRQSERLIIKIHLLDRYLELARVYQQVRSKSTSAKEIENCTRRIEEICATAHAAVKVDNTRRITIPSLLIKKTGWQSGDTLYCQGLGESITVSKK